MSYMLFLVGAIILICIGANRVSTKIGLPSLLIFIAIGMIFGDEGIFKIPFSNYNFAEEICSIALIFIMFYGGFGTKWDTAKPVAKQSICLSSLGVILTTLLTTLFCHLVLSFDIMESFLVGSVLGCTDAASVFFILRSKKLSLKHGTAPLLEIESGSNDPTAYTLTMIGLILIKGNQAQSIGYIIFAQVAYGIIFGVVIALTAVILLKMKGFPKDGIDTIFVMAVAILAYALPSMFDGNGYLSAYLAGIIIGNSEIRNKVPLVHFFDGVTSLMQILIFFLLGLLSFPHQIIKWGLPALVIALFLTFAARPAAVFVLLKPMGASMRQILLVSWAGLRGASSIVFAIVVVSSGIPMQTDIFHLVFCISLLSVAIQGSLLPWVSKKLDMVDNEDVSKTFNDYQDERDMCLISTKITEEHLWAGKKIQELNLYADILVVIICRGEETIIPNGNTKIKPGDIIVLSGENYDGQGNITLKEVKIEECHKWNGKKIKELSLPSKTLIMMIKKEDGTTVVPNGELEIQRGDTLVLNDF